jgi:hypothetical protein
MGISWKRKKALSARVAYARRTEYAMDVAFNCALRTELAVHIVAIYPSFPYDYIRNPKTAETVLMSNCLD